LCTSANAGRTPSPPMARTLTMRVIGNLPGRAFADLNRTVTKVLILALRA
jgi:hypothetical protein